MPDKSRQSIIIVARMAMLAMLCSHSVASAQVAVEDLQLPISLDAETTDYDGKSSMLMFRGLRLSQGKMGIEADIGRATKLDFEDSVWQFSGNVRINTENGQITCDVADLKFSNHQLQNATITGAPATFELRRPETDETTYAEAGKLNYNFASGVVEFSENAKITEGGNQITSNFLVYNIAEQRINAQSRGVDGERVKIIYTPKPVNGKAGDTDTGAPEVRDQDAGTTPLAEPVELPAESTPESPAGPAPQVPDENTDERPEPPGDPAG